MIYVKMCRPVILLFALNYSVLGYVSSEHLSVGFIKENEQSLNHNQFNQDDDIDKNVDPRELWNHDYYKMKRFSTPYKKKFYKEQIMSKNYIPTESCNSNCPKDYQFNQGQCIKTIIKPPTKQCVPGEDFIDGVCIHFCKGQLNCPAGTEFYNDVCIHVETVPPVYTCPQSSLNDQKTKCVRRGSSLCSDGALLRSGKCIHTFPPTFNCPKGTIHHGHGCLKEIKINSIPTCPIGSNIDSTGTRCLQTHYAGRRCPNGFHLNLRTGECLKRVQKINTECENGFIESTKNNFICEKKVQTPPIIVCPAHTLYNAKTKECVSTENSSPQCPGRSQPSNTTPGTCETRIPAIGACPNGTLPIGYGTLMRCKSISKQVMSECCPPEYSLINEECQKIELLLPTLYCGGGECIRRFEPTSHCPKNTIKRKQDCIKQISIHCNQVDAIHNDLNDTIGFVSEDPNDQPTDSTESVVTANVYHQDHESCTQDIISPVTYTCPKGSEFDGEMCVQQISSYLELRCEKGLLNTDKGRCIHKIVVPMKDECYRKSTRVGTLCLQFKDELPLYKCPKHSISDNSGQCIIREPMYKKKSIQSMTPNIVCQKGQLIGNYCVFMETHFKHKICPKGSIDAHHVYKLKSYKTMKPSLFCILSAGEPQSITVQRKIQVINSCPQHTIKKGHICYSYEHVNDLLPFCPSPSLYDPIKQICYYETTPISTNQLTEIEPTLICPSESRKKGTECLIETLIPPTMSCPVGYERSKNELWSKTKGACYKKGDIIYVCPSNNVYTSKGCISQMITQPILSQ